jgi:integrase
VEIPLHPELIAFFAENPSSPFAGTPLFPSLAKDKSGGRNGLSAQFRAIMEAADISRNVTRRTEDGAARETAARSLHSLRHTFTSWLAKADVPEEVRQKMTGHTDSRTHPN